MFHSPRLLIVAAALSILATATVLHVLPHGAPLAGRPLFAPTAPPPSPAPLSLPKPSVSPGPGWLPPVLRGPGGFWSLLNRDTAATTRGQIGLVRVLENTVRDQIRSLLEHPLGAA